MQHPSTNEFLKKVSHSKFFKTFVEPTKQIIIPGFDGVPLFYVLKFFVNSIISGALPTRASGMAFSFFLAFFPSIIFLISLIPFIPIDNFQVELLLLLKGIMPGNAYEAVRTTLEDLILIQRGGLLSFGVIMALVFATNGVSSMIDAFNSNYAQHDTRTYFKQRIVALVLTIILFIMLISAISLIITSELFLNFISLRDGLTFYLISFSKWLIILALFFFSLSSIYYLGPSKNIKWKFISAGSTLATILSIITSVGFTFYINNFGQYNKLYGSIGTLIVVLLWIYFNCYILLLGFELNASIRQANNDFTKIEPKED